MGRCEVRRDVVIALVILLWPLLVLVGLGVWR